MLTKLYIVALLLLVPALPVLAATSDEPTATNGTAAEALNKLQANQEQLQDKQSELKELDEKIQGLSQKHESASNEAELAADQLAYVSKQLDTAQLQYDQTLLSVTVVNQEIKSSEAEIASLHEELDDSRQQLKDVLRALYQQEQSSLLDVFLGSANLGTLINERRTYRALQQKALEYVEELKKRESKIVDHVTELSGQQEQLQQLKEIQAYQQADLAEQRQTKNQFLKLKQSDQSRYAREIAEAKEAKTEIEQQLFSLRNIGVEFKLDDARQAARYASSLTGVRPALLLGIVKVETNVGQTLGSGKFPDDMHPASRDAFIRLTTQLKLDPYNTPISRRPTSYQGWGGAIGPGQFLPDTWERLIPRISGLVNKTTPNPFELSDALVGTGIMLADRGAADPAKEVEAVARYLAGPNWQYHLWYSARVLAVAAEYEKESL